MPAIAVDAVIAQTNPQSHTNTCSDSGCSLSLSGVPTPNVLISMEHPASPVPRGQPHCDYLFVGGDDGNSGPWVAPIELTTGRKRASELLAQIRGVTSIADRLLPQGISYRFNPIAAYRRALKPDEIANLRRRNNSINFRGQRQIILLVPCGTRLIDALPD